MEDQIGEDLQRSIVKGTSKIDLISIATISPSVVLGHSLLRPFGRYLGLCI
jgi:hypothetical protein